MYELINYILYLLKTVFLFSSFVYFIHLPICVCNLGDKKNHKVERHCPFFISMMKKLQKLLHAKPKEVSSSGTITLS